jgi:hypothetical protein
MGQVRMGQVRIGRVWLGQVRVGTWATWATWATWGDPPGRSGPIRCRPRGVSGPAEGRAKRSFGHGVQNTRLKAGRSP